MVRTCSDFLYTNQATEFFDEQGFKITPLITMEAFWESVMDEKLLPKTSSYCGGFLVSSRYGHSIFGEVVSNDQDILCVVTIRL